MNLKKLKMHLGVLTLSNLEAAGFVDSEEESTKDGVIIRVTPDEYNKEFNEVMWASSVNNDQGRFAMLMHAMLYDKDTAEEMGKPAEVAQVFMNKEKAAMILDTIRHAYPELMEEIQELPVGGHHICEEDDDIVDLFEEDDDDDCNDTCIGCGGPLEEIEKDMLREAGEPLPTPKETSSVLTTDEIIDAHLLVKQGLQEVTTSPSEVKNVKVGEPYNYMYVTSSRPNELVISFDELDIVNQMKSAVNAPYIIGEEAAKCLLNSILEAFPKLKDTK